MVVCDFDDEHLQLGSCLDRKSCPIQTFLAQIQGLRLEFAPVLEIHHRGSPGEGEAFLRCLRIDIGAHFQLSYWLPAGQRLF